LDTPLVSVGVLGSGSPPAVGEALGLGDALGLVVGDALGLALGDALGLALGDALGDAVGLGGAVPSFAAYRFLPSLW
jgi:hypothetical protein